MDGVLISNLTTIDKYTVPGTPPDLVDAYPRFFWSTVEPYIGDALRYLNLTSEGKQRIANLYSHVFAIEHQRLTVGPHLGE